MIMIYTRFSADSRSSLTKNLAQPSSLPATCTFAIRTSRSLRYLATPKLVPTHTNYGKAGLTQSEFELHALSEVPGTPKMVLSHMKYGKAGCDREITPRLGVCDRDITTLSAHALIGHCLGNSHVTCQKAVSVPSSFIGGLRGSKRPAILFLWQSDQVGTGWNWPPVAPAHDHPPF